MTTDANATLVAADAARGQRVTDMGNSERLKEQHGEHLRYCYPQGCWYIWTGQRWKADAGGEVMRLADNVVKNLYAEAAMAADDDRRDLARHAARSEDLSRRRAMVEGARHLLPVLPDELDTHPYLLNVANGVLDLKTGRLGQHDPALLLTTITSALYYPTATCPTWETFLETVLGGDRDLIAYIKRAFGYCLTGDTGEQVMFLPFGTGANGKSTLLEVLRALLGDLAATADPSVLLASKRDSGAATPGLAALRGVRAALVSEVNQGKDLDAASIKWITGGETVTARLLYQDLFQFRPQFRIWLAVNHRPGVTDTSDGMWRRLHAIPFSVTIPEAQRDHRLPALLAAELDGILAWAVQGCMEWQRDGLQAPAKVTDATAQYRADSDPIAQFLADTCEADPENVHLYIDKPALKAAYDRWCQANTLEPVSPKALTQALKDKGFGEGRTNQARLWRGISIKTQVTGDSS